MTCFFLWLRIVSSSIHTNHGKRSKHVVSKEIQPLMRYGIRSIIENLLSSLPRMFAENRTPTSVFGSAIKGGLLSLVNGELA